MKKRIAQVVVGLPVEGPFDYRVDDKLASEAAVGKRAKVLFNRRPRMGVITGFKKTSPYKRLNPLLDVLDPSPVLDKPALKLTKNISDYYGCSWGDAMETYLPRYLRRPKMAEEGGVTQRKSAKKVPKNSYTLIHDTTRDKRWKYLNKQIASTVKRGKAVIFLVPEESMIPAVKSRITGLDETSILSQDKRLAPKREAARWFEMARGRYQLVLGTRSAVFAPLPKLGLIVVFDEENPSFKQEQNPHYHVHEVAAMRRDIEKCRVVFVSSAPLTETYSFVKRKKGEYVLFKQEEPAALKVVDMSNYNPRRTSIVSFPLQNQMEKTLQNGGKVILYLNKKSKKLLLNEGEKVPRYRTTMGVEKLESQVAHLYPAAEVALYTSETKKFPQSADIVIATQALMKKREVLSRELLAVINFDAEFNRMDYRSPEHSLAVLVTLRHMAGETMIVQTRDGKNDVIKYFRNQRFQAFYRNELKVRKELDLPPYRHIIAVHLRGNDEEKILKKADDVLAAVEAGEGKGFDISDPMPDLSAQLQGRFRYTIMVKCKTVKTGMKFVKDALKSVRGSKDVIITVDVDP